MGVGWCPWMEGREKACIYVTAVRRSVCLLPVVVRLLHNRVQDSAAASLGVRREGGGERGGRREGEGW